MKITIKELATRYNLPYQTVANRMKRNFGISAGEFELTEDIETCMLKPKARIGRNKSNKGKVEITWVRSREPNLSVSKESKRLISNILDSVTRRHSEFGMNWEDIGAEIGKSRTGATNIFKAAMGKILDGIKDIQESPEVKAQVFLEVLRETYKEKKL